MPLFRKKNIIKFVPCINSKEIAVKISQVICEEIKHNKKSILGFDANTSLIEICEQIALQSKKDKINFTNIVSFNTDEYVDIDRRYKQYSKTNFMKDNLFSRVDVQLENIYFPSIENYKNYDKKIQKLGGIDLLILDVGANGYVAFNEPYTKFSSETHIAELENNTRTYLMNFFDEKINVPTQALTMGIKTILKAKKIILIGIGESKAAAISKLFDKKYLPIWPITAMLYHKDVTVYADIAACQLMQK